MQRGRAAPHETPRATTGLKLHCFGTDPTVRAAYTHSPPELRAMDRQVFKPTPPPSEPRGHSHPHPYPCFTTEHHHLCPTQPPGRGTSPQGTMFPTLGGSKGSWRQAGLTGRAGGAQGRSEPSRDPATCSVIIRLVCFYLKYYPLTSRITKVAQQYRQTVNINRSV